MELEVLSPLYDLEPGQEVSYQIQWSLYRKQGAL